MPTCELQDRMSSKEFAEHASLCSGKPEPIDRFEYMVAYFMAFYGNSVRASGKGQPYMLNDFLPGWSDIKTTKKDQRNMTMDEMKGIAKALTKAMGGKVWEKKCEEVS